MQSIPRAHFHSISKPHLRNWFQPITLDLSKSRPPSNKVPTQRTLQFQIEAEDCWRSLDTPDFNNHRTAISGGSVVVVHEEPHPQMTGTLSYRPEETGGDRQRRIARHTTQAATGRPKSRVLPWPEDCTVGSVARRPFEVAIFIAYSSGERRGSRNHPSNIIERDRYGGRGVLVWGGIMSLGGSRTDLHIFDTGSVNGTRYCNDILLPYVRLFSGAMGLQFLFMDDNAPCHRTVALPNSSLE
ncbi:transposable element Tcb2 transposase [Trichonephila clavipes]|nr:transposable element Tcb2 transposase [Trichonephila clavipes]